MKYPRTLHFPFSPGATKDDKICKDFSTLIRRRIVITEKMDGSNFCFERDNCFARSHSQSPNHSSFDVVKSIHARIKYKIPKNYQLFGEACFAKHSIEYQSLPDYFLLFGVRNLTTNYWSSWKEVRDLAEEFGLATVPELFDGIAMSTKELQELVEDFCSKPSNCGGEREGVVVRLADDIYNENFSSSVIKWVRANHVTSDQHWLHQKIVKNNIAF